jgi:hypothetical protein
MERYLCIHGHFYQPPRENPWLEAVELQDSAAPYHDWNERVAVECYAPNATARILEGHEAQIHEKSAWSCPHGVGRWMSDCGCNTGGHPDWNQAWRAPLRHSLDWLRDQRRSRRRLRDGVGTAILRSGPAFGLCRRRSAAQGDP